MPASLSFLLLFLLFTLEPLLLSLLLLLLLLRLFILQTLSVQVDSGLSENLLALSC